jgi:hypothetical protein
MSKKQAIFAQRNGAFDSMRLAIGLRVNHCSRGGFSWLSSHRSKTLRLKRH